MVHSDVLVIGAGIAGLIAAVHAAELGCGTIVLERGTGDAYPSNTRYSSGVLHIVRSDPKGAKADLVRAIEATGLTNPDPRLVDAVAEGGPRLIDWLLDHGIRLMRGSTPLNQGWVLMPPRQHVHGYDWRGRGPDRMLRALVGFLSKSDGILQLGARARSLVMEDGRCCGVEADVGGERIRYQSGNVILADGGFQGNLDLLRRFVSPAPERLWQRGASTGMGDGLLMAIAAGAATVDLNRFYGHLLSRDVFHDERLSPYPQIDDVASAGIVVTSAGKRIADEGRGGIFMANTLAERTDPMDAVVICDTAIWEREGKVTRIPVNPHVETGGGTVHRADTIRDLAGRCGIAADELEATVDAYNAALREDRLDELDPPRSTSKASARSISVSPFIAIPVCAGITYTMGGLKIDDHARVLRPDGSPIEGLYAAGATTGGLEGGKAVSYVGGLVRSGIFAIRAAEHVAKA